MNLRVTAARLLERARVLRAAHEPRRCASCGRTMWDDFGIKQAIDMLRAAAARCDHAATILGEQELGGDDFDSLSREDIEMTIAHLNREQDASKTALPELTRVVRVLAEHLIERGDA